jgi:hypothetical protein
MFPFVRRSTYEAVRRERLHLISENAKMVRRVDDAEWNAERYRAALETVRRVSTEAMPSESVLED